MTSKKLKTLTAINWSYRPFDCNLGKLPKTFESGSMEAKSKASSNQSSQLALLWLRPGQGRVLVASEWLSGNPAEWCKLSTPLAETGPSLSRSFGTSDQVGGWWESNKEFRIRRLTFISTIRPLVLSSASPPPLFFVITFTTSQAISSALNICLCPPNPPPQRSLLRPFKCQL